MDRTKAVIIKEKNNQCLQYNSSICNRETAEDVGLPTTIATSTTTTTTTTTTTVEATSSALPSSKKRKKKQLSVFNAAHAKMAIAGLLRVQAALQNTMKPEMIRDSFNKAGAYPYSLRQILCNCSTKLSSDEEQKNIVIHISDLTKKMKKQGKIFEKDFDIYVRHNEFSSRHLEENEGHFF